MLLPNLEGTMILDKSIDCLVSSAHSNNDLVVFDLDKESFLSVSVDAFLLSNKEKAGFPVRVIIVDELCQFLVREVVLNWLIDEIDPLQVVHVLMYSLKLLLSIFYLNEKLLLIFDNTLQMSLAVFVASLKDLKLALNVMSS